VTLSEELIETESDQMASKPLTPEYQQELPFIIENSESNQQNMFYRVLHVVFENFVYNRNHTSEFAGMALSIINGAFHATAWHSHFPTDIESLFWKISCLGMVVFPDGILLRLRTPSSVGQRLLEGYIVDLRYGLR
jgi:hypothetical protein